MLKIILYLFFFYLLILIFFYSVQRKLIYYPAAFSPSPAEMGVPEMQVVKLLTKDGFILRAWFRPPTRPDFPTILYLHGNAGHIGNRAFIIRPFLNKGYGVLLLTYRGYSGNPGSPNEEGLYNDARAAMQFLAQKNILDRNIILYGNSIGAAVAIQIASEHRVKAVILQSPFTSLADVGQFHYPFFPVKWLISDKFNSIRLIHTIKAPVLILYGEKDRIIPPQFARKLYDGLKDPKQIFGLPNRGHNDLFEPDLIIRFIREYTLLHKKNIDI